MRDRLLGELVHGLVSPHSQDAESPYMGLGTFRGGKVLCAVVVAQYSAY